MRDQFEHVKVSVSNRTVIRVLVIILAAFLCLKLFIKVEHLMQLIFISFFFAIALSPAVSAISKNLRIKSRGIATAIAYVLIIGIISFFLTLATPSLARQTVDYAKNLPTNIAALKNPNTEAGRLVKRYHLTGQIDNLVVYAKKHTVDLKVPVLSTATKIGGFLESILIVLVLTFMMLVEGPVLFKNYWRLRFGRKDWHIDVAKKMNRIVTGYVNGQILLALIGGVFTYIVLEIVSHILNVQINSIALSVIIFFTGLIPMFGHIIGFFAVAVACLFVSWQLALIVSIILFIYIQIENITFQPYIQSKFNELTPLLVFIAALIGIYAWGIFGAFVAIPLAGCLKVCFKEYLIQRKLIVD